MLHFIMNFDQAKVVEPLLSRQCVYKIPEKCWDRAIDGDLVLDQPVGHQQAGK